MAVSLALDGERIVQPVVAMGGVAPHVVRLPTVESALQGHPLPPKDLVESLLAQAVNPIDDHRGSAAYKRHIAAVLGERALRASVRQLLSGEGVD